MRELSIRSFADFLAIAHNTYEVILDRPRQDLLWNFQIPGFGGRVLDSWADDDIGVNRVELNSRSGASFDGCTRLRERMVKVAWITEGAVSYDISGARSEYDAYGGTCYVVAFDGEIRTRVSIAPGMSVSGLSVMLPVPRFHSLLCRFGVRLPELLEQRLYSPSRMPFKFVTVMPSELANSVRSLFETIDRMAGVPRPDLSSTIASTMALIGEHSRWPARVVSPLDIERVRAARSILHSSLTDPPQIRELAHAVGMNEYKLKAGYKQAFGRSIGTDLHVTRMERAVSMIVDGERTISDAAAQVGYGNPGDFSVRFRKQFGMSPSEYRNAVREPVRQHPLTAQ